MSKPVGWAGNVVLMGSLAALVLVVYGVVRFPASLANGGTASFLIVAGALAAYGAAALWACRSSNADARSAVRTGAVLGAGLGGFAIVNHTLEIWATLPPLLGTVLGAGLWGLMFLGFGIACSATLAQGRPFAFGLLSSVWCAMVMAILLIVFALVVGFAFMSHVERALSGLYAASGMTDARAFVTRDLFSNASLHLLAAPVAAVFCGILSVVAFRVLAPLGRRPAGLLAGAALLLLVSGVASIRHASSLERSHRPPFIDFGLAALAVALVSVHPLVLALREPRRPQPGDGAQSQAG